MLPPSESYGIQVCTEGCSGCWLAYIANATKMAKIVKKITGVPKYFMNGIIHVVLCYVKGWGFYEACKS